MILSRRSGRHLVLQSIVLFTQPFQHWAKNRPEFVTEPFGMCFITLLSNYLLNFLTDCSIVSSSTLSSSRRSSSRQVLYDSQLVLVKLMYILGGVGWIFCFWADRKLLFANSQTIVQFLLTNSSSWLVETLSTSLEKLNVGK